MPAPKITTAFANAWIWHGRIHCNERPSCRSAQPRAARAPARAPGHPPRLPARAVLHSLVTPHPSSQTQTPVYRFDSPLPVLANSAPAPPSSPLTSSSHLVTPTSDPASVTSPNFHPPVCHVSRAAVKPKTPPVWRCGAQPLLLAEVRKA